MFYRILITSVFLFLITGCGVLHKTSHALDTSLCNKGVSKYCLNPGINNISSEIVNKQKQDVIFEGTASTVGQGYSQLGMACLGDSNNAKIIYDNYVYGRIFPCSYAKNPNDGSYNPLKVSFCYFKDGKEVYFDVFENYMPKKDACIVRYYTESEAIDELLEHQNDENARRYIRKIDLREKWGEEDFIRLSVLWLPSVKKDEVKALQNMKNACINSKKLKYMRIVPASVFSICNDYEFVKQINEFLCKKYKFTQSCNALRGIR